MEQGNKRRSEQANQKRPSAWACERVVRRVERDGRNGGEAGAQAFRIISARFMRTPDGSLAHAHILSTRRELFASSDAGNKCRPFGRKDACASPVARGRSRAASSSCRGRTVQSTQHGSKRKTRGEARVLLVLRVEKNTQSSPESQREHQAGVGAASTRECVSSGAHLERLDHLRRILRVHDGGRERCACASAVSRTYELERETWGGRAGRAGVCARMRARRNRRTKMQWTHTRLETQAPATLSALERFRARVQAH
eukprot:1070983-Pleurochrysis_carterae.AAC.1